MLNKAFYAVAADNKPNVLFHDVVRGSNLGYDATPGWDYATGLGSPIADRLGATIVAYLARAPAVAVSGSPVPTQALGGGRGI